MKPVNKKQQSLLNLLDTYILYYMKSGKKPKELHITNQQMNTYIDICGKKTEHSNENTQVDINLQTREYRGISLKVMAQ